MCAALQKNSANQHLVSVTSLVPRDGETVYPTVVATHPWKPNQIAVGMSDGAVYVLEPLDTDDGQVGSDTSSEQRVHLVMSAAAVVTANRVSDQPMS